MISIPLAFGIVVILGMAAAGLMAFSDPTPSGPMKLSDLLQSVPHPPKPRPWRDIVNDEVDMFIPLK